MQTEDGKDWYYHRLNFQSDTLKVCYGSDNVIRMASYNVQAITPPAGCSVSEVAREDVPEDFDDMGNWVFDGSAIVRRVYTAEELAAQALAKKNILIAAATAAINPLQDAVDLEIATEDELAQLQAWKKYRVLLNRVVTSAAEIAWPEEPK
ncbi:MULTISPECIES: tail fiber assembly protein [unclassified Pantoea]|uniref:tail fiber assembly protein n=1 Tax=unclassified Pantoea TaxID=2630326 RepID=UPI00257D93E2|nr:MULTISPECIES: tail fiber assembly protein [unclassified Pantoea]MDU5474036.1 tail fiber assembly protein [Pantoea sp.]